MADGERSPRQSPYHSKQAARRRNPRERPIRRAGVLRDPRCNRGRTCLDKDNLDLNHHQILLALSSYPRLCRSSVRSSIRHQRDKLLRHPHLRFTRHGHPHLTHDHRHLRRPIHHILHRRALSPRKSRPHQTTNHRLRRHGRSPSSQCRNVTALRRKQLEPGAHHGSHELHLQLLLHVHWHHFLGVSC